jgi:hypothetical protein
VAQNDDSILDSIKKLLSIEVADTTYDIDVIVHVNSVFSTLQQLGLGPASALYIADNTTKWSDFIGANPNVAAVKSYVFMRVKLLFDPPTLSYVLQSFQAQIDQLEWRFTVAADEFAWQDPADSLNEPPQPLTVASDGA